MQKKKKKLRTWFNFYIWLSELKWPTSWNWPINKSRNQHSQPVTHLIVQCERLMFISKSTTGTHSEPVQFSCCPPIYIPNIRIKIIFPSTLATSNGLFPKDFVTKITYVFIVFFWSEPYNQPIHRNGYLDVGLQLHYAFISW